MSYSVFHDSIYGMNRRLEKQARWLVWWLDKGRVRLRRDGSLDRGNKQQVLNLIAKVQRLEGFLASIRPLDWGEIDESVRREIHRLADELDGYMQRRHQGYITFEVNPHDMQLR